MTAVQNSSKNLRFAVAFALGTAAALAAVAAPAAPAPAAEAQAAPAQSGGLEEVTVTAQRRASNLQSTPIAVSAIDETLIRSVGPQTISDLAAYVPNFSATKITGFNAASFAMRGVGNTDIIVYNEAPVAVLVDDFVMPSVQTQILDAFDLQDVQVLRGPQGTLFGKNTTGGAVLIRTKMPELNETSFEARAQYGSFDSYNLQGAIDFPIWQDRIALRLVGSQETVGGWMKNYSSNTIVSPSQPQYNGTYTGDGSRSGGTDVFSGRAKLLWQITDDLKTVFQYEAVRDRSQTPAAVNATPTNVDPKTGFPYFVFANLGIPGKCSGDPLNCAGISNRDGYLINMPRGHEVTTDGFFLNTDWTIDAGTFTWVQGYRSQDSSLPSDYTGIVGPLSPFDANRSDRRKTWQEEIRFAGKAIGNFDYVVGAFTQHDDTKFCVAQLLGLYDQFGVPTPPGLQPGGYNNNPQVLCNAQEARSSALFGEGNWHASDKLTLTLGARYTDEKKDWIGRQQVFVQQLPSPTGAIIPAFTYQQLGSLMNAANFTKYSFGVVSDSHKWTEPTYRLSASYQFTPEIFGYGTFSHGFRAGGYNDQVGTSGLPITADERKPTNPEKADSFEIGLKTELLDRTLRINEALFYVKYKDIIRQVVVPVTNANGQPGQETLFRNAAEMSVYGIESEITWLVTDGLTVRLPASYQHCKYDQFTSASAGYDLSTTPVNRCPEFTATGNVSYQVPVPSTDGRVSLDLSANYQSKNLNTFSIVNPAEYARTYVDSRTLVDASVTYTAADDRWFVRAIGRNLTDKRYRISGQNVDPLWVWELYGQPRYYGGEIGFKFGQK